MGKEDLSLTSPIDDLEEKILTTDNTDELYDIINLFNLNLQKRNIIRNKKLNDVQDLVVSRMLEKIENEPWEFSNDDLIKFHRIIQNTLDKGNEPVNKELIPTIQVNQQINVSAPTFTRESRAKILAAVHDILENNPNSAQEEIEEVEIIND